MEFHVLVILYLMPVLGSTNPKVTNASIPCLQENQNSRKNTIHLIQKKKNQNKHKINVQVFFLAFHIGHIWKKQQNLTQWLKYCILMVSLFWSICILNILL